MLVIRIALPLIVALMLVVWIVLNARHGRRLSEFEQLITGAPVELSRAVEVLADNARRMSMLATLGLGAMDRGFPRLEWWDYTETGIEVEWTLLCGQSTKTWTDPDMLDALAHYLMVPKVLATSPEPARIRLQMRAFDTLAAPVMTPAVVPGGVDLEAAHVGMREDGLPWLLRILYAHILLAGATGSGKGSVLWSILNALGWAIKAGLVDVWMADPKGGAEFGRGEGRLFVRFTTDADSILAMLREAVEVMDERLARMRTEGIRKLVPTLDEPLILIIIDEAASLSSYADRDQQQEFRRLTGLLLSKGRAAAVTVIAALQDPSKETMPNRQLFPVRIGLRLDEPTQNTMVHGQGAKDRGARCDEISELTPGVGYVGEDGTAEFVRVRAFMIPDYAADRIVDMYSPAPEITGPTEDYSGFDPDDLGDEGDDDGPAVAA